MNTYSEYKEIKSKQDAIVDMLSDKLNSYPKGAFGMIEESVRMSDDYKALKVQYAKEFKKIQDINSFGMKNFKKEIYKEHEEKRKQKRNEKKYLDTENDKIKIRKIIVENQFNSKR